MSKFVFNNYKFYNLEFFKQEIRYTIYLLLLNNYNAKYAELKRKFKNNLQLDDLVNKYFSNIYLYVVNEKATNLNFLIFYNHLNSSYYYLVCNNKDGIFIDNNLIQINNNLVIKTEFNEFLKIKNAKINYDNYSIFSYYNGEKMCFPKKNKNLKEFTNQMVCISDFINNQYENILQNLKNNHNNINISNLG